MIDRILRKLSTSTHLLLLFDDLPYNDTTYCTQYLSFAQFLLCTALKASVLILGMTHSYFQSNNLYGKLGMVGDCVGGGREGETAGFPNLLYPTTSDIANPTVTTTNRKMLSSARKPKKIL